MQWWRNHPVATRHMFRLSSKMLLGEPNYIQDMLLNSWTVITLFLRTNSLTQTTFSLILLWWWMSWAFSTLQHTGNTPLQLRKPLKNLFSSFEVATKLACLQVSSVFPSHSSFTIAPHSSVTTSWGMHEHWPDSALLHCYFIKVEVLSMTWHLADYSDGDKLKWANNTDGW